MDIDELPPEDIPKTRQLDSPEEKSDYPDNTPNPLRIKLSHLKPEQQSSLEQRTMTRICYFCGRGFANGKALGGHIRIHSPAMKNNKAESSKIMHRLNQRSDLRLNMNHGKDVLSGPGRRDKWKKEHICRICDRAFPSEKSLFGHMRFHPERTYRGARPPSSEGQSKTSSSNSEDSGQEIKETQSCYEHGEVPGSTVRDLLKDLPNWSKTDKRGRQSTSDAARSLMRLSCEGMASPTQIDEFPPGFHDHKNESESPLKKLKLADQGDIKGRKGNHTQVQVQPASLTGKEFAQNHAQQRKERDLNTVDEEEEAGHNDKGPNQSMRRVRFQCSDCGRIFPSFQALGGHRSSHNKDKGSTASASHNFHTQQPNSPCPVLEASASSGIASAASGRANKEEAGAEPSAANASTGAHQCRICRRSFQTGQALGGHKRCHRTTVGKQSSERFRQGDSTDNPSLDPKGESSPGDQASQVGPRALVIDLNKPPPMEDEDGSVSGLN